MQHNALSLTDPTLVSWLEKLRWPDGRPMCPRCGDHARVRPSSCRPNHWHCRICNRGFNVLAGTPLMNSNLPVNTWMAAYRLLRKNPGMRAGELSRRLGVTGVTAGRLLKDVKKLPTEAAFLVQMAEMLEDSMPRAA